MKVVFVRHGKDDEKYRGGWSQLDLVPEGEEQAKKLAKHLFDNHDLYQIRRIISSDLQRTVSTANYIAAELSLQIETDQQLREMNNGDLAGMLNEIVLEKYPGLFFSSLDMDEPYPNGESPREFFLRIREWFEEFCHHHRKDSGNIAVVTHSGVINILYHLVNHIPWSNKSWPVKVSNCSIHVLNLNCMKFEIENKVDFLSE